MDAITHCIEAIPAPGDNPPADGIGLDGLWRGWRHLRRAVEDGSDRQARWEMMMASTEGALAFVKALAPGVSAWLKHFRAPSDLEH